MDSDGRAVGSDEWTVTGGQWAMSSDEWALGCYSGLEVIAAMGVQNYRELVAWQKAMDLVESIYAVTRAWPREEVYGLTSQIRRAAVSIPSNIAEGQGRSSTKEFLHHLSIAYSSLREVETQVLIAQRLDYLAEEDASPLLRLASEVGRLINGLSNSLANKEGSINGHRQ